MITINGKPFEIYDLDSESSILSRIASDLNTVPILLYIKRKPDWKTKDDLNIKVKDVLKNLKNLKNLKKTNKISPDDIDNLSNKTKISKDILYKFVRETEEKIDEEIQDNKTLSSEYTEKCKKFQKIKGIENSSFIIQKLNIELTFNNKNIYSLYDIFNIILTTDKVPVVIYNNFTKIYKKFNSTNSIYNGWDQFRSQDIILLKVISTVDTSVRTGETEGTYIQEYNTVIIREKDNNFILEFDIEIDKKYLNQDIIINNILETLDVDYEPKITKKIYTNIGGEFMFLNQSLNLYIYSDLVMNNKLFSSMLVVNESLKASKNRSDLFIIFSDPYYGETRVNITPKKIEGEDNIRVKVKKSSNIESINSFINIMSKLFQKYNELYDETVKLYMEYGIDFKNKIVFDKDIEKSQEDLFQINPELFARNYTRRCPNKVSIVEDKDVDKLQNQGVQLMRFPRSETISNQYWYRCDHPVYKYPGLKVNNLEQSNRKKYPYIPCCYMKDQKEKINYKKYFNPEEEKIIETKTQSLLTSSKKILKFNNLGKLPEEVLTFFKNIDNSWEYVRMGMDITTSSFIECLLKAKSDNLSIDFESRIDVISTARLELTDFSICRQHAYDMSVDTIKNISMDENQYFDPKIFISLIEQVYGINIYLFERIDNKTNMIIPRYTHGYYRLSKKAQSLCILIHTGSETDLTPFPQCELICRYKPDQSIKYFFKDDSKFSKILSDNFNTLSLSYSLDKKIKQVVFPLPENVEIKSQVIDSYGKTRLLNINTDSIKDEKLILITSPIPPFDCPEIRFDSNMGKNSIETALRYIDILHIKDIYQFVPEDKITNITGKIGNVDVTIPIIDTNPLEDMPTIKEGIVTYSEKESVLNLYNKNKKAALYVSEYFFWMFSLYIEDKYEYNDIINNQDEIILKFVEEQVYIKEGFKYNAVSNKFTIENNSGVIYDNKFIATSKEMIKRLIFMLKLQIKFNLKKLINYKNTYSINNFYNNTSDFIQNMNEVILEGNNSIEKWIQEQDKKNVLRNSVYIQHTNEPYFFKNSLIDKNIVLLQNTDDIDKAISIAIEWYTKNINNGDTIVLSSETDYEFTLYNYRSENEIERIKVEGKENTYDIRIIAAKISDNVNNQIKTIYSTVLKL
jgi:hypothetical protein